MTKHVYHFTNAQIFQKQLVLENINGRKGKKKILRLLMLLMTDDALAMINA